MQRALAIPTVGAVGLVVVGRAAIYYAGTDSLAFLIALVMGFAFLIGLYELYRISTRTRRLHEELRQGTLM